MSTDEQIVEAVAARFRLPIANLAMQDPRCRRRSPSRWPASTTSCRFAAPIPISKSRPPIRSTWTRRRCSPSRPGGKCGCCSFARQDPRTSSTSCIARPTSSPSCSPASPSSTTSPSSATSRTSTAPAPKRPRRGPIIKLVDTLIADGITSRASDIHVEPVEAGVVVRYRIDGVLRQVMKIPRSAGIPLVSRVKIMSGMDIADRLRPQDGRCRVAVNGNPVDLRVSTLPASLGEKVGHPDSQHQDDDSLARRARSRGGRARPP